MSDMENGVADAFSVSARATLGADKTCGAITSHQESKNLWRIGLDN